MMFHFKLKNRKRLHSLKALQHKLWRTKGMNQIQELTQWMWVTDYTHTIKTNSKSKKKQEIWVTLIALINHLSMLNLLKWCKQEAHQEGMCFKTWILLGRIGHSLEEKNLHSIKRLTSFRSLRTHRRQSKHKKIN
jgi:G3E family GTPase